MDLTKKELTYIGVPKEYYDEKFESPIKLDSFIYKEKVYKAKTPQVFYNLCAASFKYLSQNNFNLNGCKTYACHDFTIYSDLRAMHESLSKFQVLGILDIDQATNKRLIESFVRKWFEDGKDLILLYDKNFKTMTGYSPWFLEMLSIKEVK